MTERLEEQIEQVIDQGRGERRSILVRMAGPLRESSSVLQNASRILRKRSVALTARDSLPVDRDPEQTATRAMPRPFVRSDQSALEANLSVQAAAIKPRDQGQLKAQALQDLQPLLENTRVRRALKREEPGSLEGAADNLWASTSIAMDVSVDDLRALPEEVPGIDEIHPNRTLRIPPIGQAHNLPEMVLENRASSWGLNRVGALAVWGAYAARGEGVKVGILDTGVDASHPDLDGKVVAWAEFDAMGGAVAGSQPHDDVGHGTHVAGTVAGGNASGQWIGVAPEAKLCCAKVLGAGGGTDAQIQAGMTWALDQHVDIISMSLGGVSLGWEMPAGYTTAIVNCLERGIPVIIAVGNEGSGTAGSPGNDIFSLSVGATDYRDRSAGFSGGRTQIVYKSEYMAPEDLPIPYSKPDLSAPGVAIVSSVPDGKWQAFNGTSMAAPHVAGVAALLLSATNLPQVSPGERAFLISDLLIGSVEELGESGQDHRYGFGRIDALRAISFARERGY
jgi:subtilisin family serine protease